MIGGFMDLIPLSQLSKRSLRIMAVALAVGAWIMLGVILYLGRHK